MENCENNQAELEENSPVCPECGTDNAAVEAPAAEQAAEAPETAEAPAAEEVPETPAETVEAPAEEKKSNTMKIVLSVAALVIVLAVLIAAIVSGSAKKAEAPEAAEDVPEASQPVVAATVPADGNPDDETCKGSYTAEDEAVIAARDVVVAHAGDKELTNAQLQVYYWMEVRNFLNQYGAYAAYFGLDYQQSLDTQMCEITDTPMTWQQYFLKNALNSWQHYQAMAAEADKEGVELEESYAQVMASMEADLEESAAANGFAGAEVLLKDSLGQCVTMQDYKDFMNLYYSGYSFFNVKNAEIQPTDEDIEAYFAEHEADYAESGLTKETCTVDVRHILVYPEGADSSTVNSEEFSEEAWAAGEVNAQAILDEWLAGEATEDSFAALANERSGDPGSNTNGGLYTEVSEGQMVPAFNDWCFDAERQVGDYGIVKTNYGYHIMYFVGRTLIWMDQVKTDLVNEKGSAMVDSVTNAYPLTVDYSAIKLGFVDLA